MDDTIAPDAGGRAAEDAAPDDGDGMRLFHDTRYDIHVARDLVTHVIGPQTNVAQRRRTGPLPTLEIEEVLDYYVEPEPYGAAAEVLRAHHLLFLSGSEGIGKRSGALALLRACLPCSRIVVLSPLSLLDDLLRHTYTADRGYLVQDWISSADSQPVERALVEQLRDRISGAGAYLVITTVRAVSTVPRHIRVDWSAPDPSKLLGLACEREGVSPLDESVADLVAERFQDCRCPREIVTFVRRLKEVGGDPDATLKLLVESAAQTVVEWFDAEPSHELVLFVCGLGFLQGLPERVFDRKLSDLARTALELWPSAADVRGGDEEPGPRVLRQTRLHRLREVSFVSVAREQARSGGLPSRERGLSLMSAHHHRQVIHELWTRYDDQLWAPVRTWVNQTVGCETAQEDLALALGVVSLAFCSPAEAREEYLDGWASAQSSTRAACWALWVASQSDELAPWALETATTWAARNTPRRAAAILAFSGELGLRYPGEARRWLWHLAQMSRPAGKMARTGLAWLFAAAVDAQEGAVGLLEFLRKQAESPQAATSASRVRQTAMAVTALTLNVVGASERLSIAALLARDRGAANTAGPLWALALRTRPVRRAALEALRETLRLLRREPDGLATIAALGDEIVRALPAAEVAALQEDLYHAMRNHSNSEEDCRAVLDVLLTVHPPQDSERRGDSDR